MSVDVLPDPAWPVPALAAIQPVDGVDAIGMLLICSATTVFCFLT